jgi:hypothetical protein
MLARLRRTIHITNRIFTCGSGQCLVIKRHFEANPMDNPEKRICGARNRQGKPCQKPPMRGKNRCLSHGGKTPKGKHTGNLVHGLYTKRLTDEEKEAFDSLELGSVDYALRMAHLILMRSVNKHFEMTANERATALELVEKRIMEEEGSMSVLRRPDTLAIIDRYMGRIGHLEKVRLEILAAAKDAGEGIDDKARDLVETLREMKALELEQPARDRDDE